MADFIVPSILFLLFSVLSAAGAYFLTAQSRSRQTAVIAALLTLFFFALLFLGLLVLLPEEGIPGG